MSAEDTDHANASQQVSDNVVLLIVALYAASFVVFGFLVDTPAEIFRGLAPDSDVTRYAAHRLHRSRRNGCRFRQRRAPDPVLQFRLLQVAREDGRRVGCLFVSCSWICAVRKEPAEHLVHRRRCVPVLQVQERAIRDEHQYGVLWSSARSHLLRDPLQHVPSPRGQLASERVYQPGHRVHSGARRGAAVQGAHGIHSVQHGIHRGPGRHPGCRALQILWLCPGPGLHLDDREQSSAEWIPVGCLRFDDCRRVLFRPGRPAQAERVDAPVGPSSYGFCCAVRDRSDLGQYGPRRRNRHGLHPVRRAAT